MVPALTPARDRAKFQTHKPDVSRLPVQRPLSPGKGLFLQSYLRMLGLVRPYMVHVVLAIVFMVLFSFFNLFTMAMISPFLKALFFMDNQAIEATVQP